MWWGDGPDGWEWIWMGLMMAIVWIPLIVVLVWLLRQFGESNAPGNGSSGGGTRREPEPDARELARRAYARGEVDRERYLEIIADLDRTEGRRPTNQ